MLGLLVRRQAGPELGKRSYHKILALLTGTGLKWGLGRRALLYWCR